MKFTTKIFTGALSIVLASHLMAESNSTVELSDQNKTKKSVAKKKNSDDLGEMQVYGTIISGQISAIKQQKEANSIVNVISADGIGKLPDRNAAEAASRIPGLSIERDQGEGRFVAVRGLPAQWSSTTLNGNRLPTAEQQNTSRATAFDFFPAEMIERIEVHKALTPDIEGDAIGGSVNFVTATAPDEQIIGASFALNYNNKAQEAGYNANLLYGDRVLDDKLGFVINFTSWDRDWATDNFESRRKSGQTGMYRLELRDYFGERKTLGLNTAAEYLINDDNKLFFRGIYGSLKDYEVNYKHRYRFDKSKFDETTGKFEGGRIEKQNIYNTMLHESYMYELGGEHTVNDKSKLNWSLATLENSFEYDDNPKSYNSWMFTRKGVTYEGLTETDSGSRSSNVIDGGTSQAYKPSTHLPSDYTSTPADYSLSTVWLWEGDIVEKDNIVAALDYDYELSDDLDLKFGFKYRDKERIAKESHRYYVPKDGVTTPTLADFNSKTQPNLSDFDDAHGVNYSSTFTDIVSENEIKKYWEEHKDSDWQLDQTKDLGGKGNPTATVENGKALSKNFTVEEQHTAAYGMGTWKYSDMWTILGGLRLEQTNTKVIGKLYDTATETLTDNIQEKDYLSVLPSVHVTYAPAENMKYRASITRSFSRPDFGAISAGGTFESNEDEYSVGNPQLDPTYSLNYDVSAEYYFGKVGIVSAGLFYKSITDPIFQSKVSKDFNGDGTLDDVKTSLNGDDASLWGAEFAYNTQFDFLSGIWSNFGINTNVTIMDSEMKIPGRNGDVKIPRQADLLYNATLFYDDTKFSARLAFNSKGEYIMEHGDSAEFDEYYAENTSLDLSAAYNINDSFTVFAEANNLTDEPMTYFLGNEDRPLQREYYGVRGQVGVKYLY